MPVRLGTLRPGDALAFDLFVKIADRYIRHTVSGDSFDQDRWARLKEKGIKKVFIPLTSEQQYLTYLDAGLNSLGSGTAPIENQAQQAQAALISMADGTAAIETEQSFKVTQGRVAKVTEFLLSDSNHVHTFLKTSGVSQDTAQHSAAVATLSLALADRMKITDKLQLSELGLACLLHDIGKDDGLVQDWNKPESEFSEEQKKIFYAHPQKADELLVSKAFVSPVIRELVKNHEEIGMGQGFPEKKKLESLSMIQQILNICNHYESYCMRRGTPPAEAGKQFFIEKVGLFKLELMTGLADVVRPPK